MSHDAMLREAVDAISKGQRIRARDLLTRLLRTDQSNVDYWLWMSSVVDTQNERVYCLESALKLDPANQTARQGLILMGAHKPGDDVIPVPPPRRATVAELEELETPKTGFRKIWATPRLRLVFLLGSFLLVVGVILGGYFSLKAIADNRRAAILTARAPIGTLLAVSTSTTGPTNTMVVRSPTPTFRGPTPLWVFLESTYTPVPPYVPTPETQYEAFPLGMRAYDRGDYPKMKQYMLEASGYDPDSPELAYFLGEAYRLNLEYEAALATYNRAIELNPEFAGAYLGRARVEKLVDTTAATLADLDQAISLDPNMGEAYLERAAYYIQAGYPITSTVQDLDTAEGLIPTSPYLYLYRSQAALSIGDVDAAIQFAEQANSMDLTLLPGYLALGEAYMAGGDFSKALEALDTYLVYVTDQPDGYLMKGRMLIEQEQYDEAVKMLDKAMKLSSDEVDIYYYRALANIGAGKAQPAINDLTAARKMDPGSFEISLALGRALMLAGRNDYARNQFDLTYNLAATDLEKAQVYYYRAQAFELLNAPNSAARDWRALLALESDQIPAEWRVTAQEHVDQIFPPTPTLSPTPARVTPTPTTKPAATTATPTRKP